jgi:glycerophosphoryl diester phosphodiesterase
MLVLAHRGLHHTLPENSLAAFQAAAALGVDGFETDVRVCACGTAVLFHDRSLRDGRAVASLTHPELTAAVGYPVPTLAAALDALVDHVWNLELKAAEALPATLAVLAAGPTPRRLLVTSFAHELVLGATAAHPVTGGLLMGHRPSVDPIPSPAALGNGRITTLVWHHELVDASLVQTARSRGLATYLFGLESPADHARARELGADAVITDHPARAG